MAITKYQMNVRLTFTHPMLATQSTEMAAFNEYNAAKANSPERAAIELERYKTSINAIMSESAEAKAGENTDGLDVEESRDTFFLRTEDGSPYISGHMLKGFFKESCSALRKIPDSMSSKIKAFKKEIDCGIFIAQDDIPLHLSGPTTLYKRPLRTSGPRGERVADPVSEQCPVGTFIELTIQYLYKGYDKNIEEWLDYGELHGLGQWRSTSAGSFTWERLPDDYFEEDAAQ